MGPIGYAGPVQPYVTGRSARGCLRVASERPAPLEMGASAANVPTGPHGNIYVDADNKPLLRAHDHDVLR